MNSWLKAGYEGFDTDGEVAQFYQQRDDDPAESDEAYADYNYDGLGEDVIAHRRCLRGEDNRHIRNADRRGLGNSSLRRSLRETDPALALYMFSSGSDSSSSSSLIEIDGVVMHRKKGSAKKKDILAQLRQRRHATEIGKHQQWASLCPFPVGFACEMLYLTRALPTVERADANTGSSSTGTIPHRQVAHHPVAFQEDGGSNAMPTAPTTSISFEDDPEELQHSLGGRHGSATFFQRSNSSFSAHSGASLMGSSRSSMLSPPLTSAHHPANRPLGPLAAHTATLVHVECRVPTGECLELHSQTVKLDLAVLLGGVELDRLQQAHRDLQALDSRDNGLAFGGPVGGKRVRPDESQRRASQVRIEAQAAKSLVNPDFSVIEIGSPEVRHLFTSQQMRLCSRIPTRVSQQPSVRDTLFQEGRFGHCAVPFSFEIARYSPKQYDTRSASAATVAIKVEPDENELGGGLVRDGTVPVDPDDGGETSSGHNSRVHSGTVEVVLSNDHSTSSPSQPLGKPHIHHGVLNRNQPDIVGHSAAVSSISPHRVSAQLNPRAAKDNQRAGQYFDRTSRSPSPTLQVEVEPESYRGHTSDMGDTPIVRVSPDQLPKWTNDPRSHKESKTYILVVGGCTSVDIAHARRVRRLYGANGTFGSDFSSWGGAGTSTNTELNLVQFVKRNTVVFDPWMCAVEAQRVGGSPMCSLPRRGVASSSQLEVSLQCIPFQSVINAPSGRCFATCVEMPLPMQESADAQPSPFHRFLLFGGTSDGLFPIGWDTEKAAIGLQWRRERRARRVNRNAARRQQQQQQLHVEHHQDHSDMNESSIGASEPSEDEREESNASPGGADDELAVDDARRPERRVEGAAGRGGDSTEVPLLAALPDKSVSDVCLLLMVDPTERVMLCDGSLLSHPRRSHRRGIRLHSLRPNQSLVTGGPCPRFGHSCVTIPSRPEMVLIFGGVGGRPTSAVEERHHSSKRAKLRLLGRGREARLPTLLNDLWELSSVTYAWREINLWHASPSPTPLPLRAFHTMTAVVDPSEGCRPHFAGDQNLPPVVVIAGGKLQHSFKEDVAGGGTFVDSASGGAANRTLEDPLSSLFTTVAAGAILVDVSTGSWRPLETPAFNGESPMSTSPIALSPFSTTKRPTPCATEGLRDIVSMWLSKFYGSISLKRVEDFQRERKRLLEDSQQSSAAPRVGDAGTLSSQKNAPRRVQFEEPSALLSSEGNHCPKERQGYRRPTATTATRHGGEVVPPFPAAGLAQGNDEGDFCLPSSDSTSSSSDEPVAEEERGGGGGHPSFASPSPDLELMDFLFGSGEGDVAPPTVPAPMAPLPLLSPSRLQSILSDFCSSVIDEGVTQENPPTTPLVGAASPIMPRAPSFLSLLTLPGCPIIHMSHGAHAAALSVALPPPGTPAIWCGRRLPSVVLFGGEGSATVPMVSVLTLPPLLPEAVPRLPSVVRPPGPTLRSLAALFLARGQPLPASSQADPWAPQASDVDVIASQSNSWAARFAVAEARVGQGPHYNLPL